MAFLQRLFKGRKTDKPHPTLPSPRDSSGNRVRAGWNTDVGQQRQHNEDAILVMEASQEGDSSLPPFGLYILADGMGGHQSGEVASSLAARILARHVLQQVYIASLDAQPSHAEQSSYQEILVEAVNQANAAVSRAVPGGGTTLICALMVRDQAYIANVGDSRAYLVSPDSLKQLTKDHSLVDRLVELGQLSVEEAAEHPQKNVLYRAVGQRGMLEVDTFMHNIPAGHSLLLCSDGLWGMLEEQEIHRVIKDAASPQIACDSLAAAANRNGGKDNISIIVVKPPMVL